MKKLLAMLLALLLCFTFVLTGCDIADTTGADKEKEDDKKENTQISSTTSKEVLLKCFNDFDVKQVIKNTEFSASDIINAMKAVEFGIDGTASLNGSNADISVAVKDGMIYLLGATEDSTEEMYIYFGDLSFDVFEQIDGEWQVQKGNGITDSTTAIQPLPPITEEESSEDDSFNSEYDGDAVYMPDAGFDYELTATVPGSTVIIPETGEKEEVVSPDDDVFTDDVETVLPGEEDIEGDYDTSYGEIGSIEDLEALFEQYKSVVMEYVDKLEIPEFTEKYIYKEKEMLVVDNEYFKMVIKENLSLFAGYELKESEKISMMTAINQVIDALGIKVYFATGNDTITKFALVCQPDFEKLGITSGYSPIKTLYFCVELTEDGQLAEAVESKIVVCPYESAPECEIEFSVLAKNEFENGALVGTDIVGKAVAIDSDSDEIVDDSVEGENYSGYETDNIYLLDFALKIDSRMYQNGGEIVKLTVTTSPLYSVKTEYSGNYATGEYSESTEVIPAEEMEGELDVNVDISIAATSATAITAKGSMSIDGTDISFEINADVKKNIEVDGYITVDGDTLSFEGTVYPDSAPNFPKSLPTFIQAYLMANKR